MPLNPQQQVVADHHETRALVIAGPGSGKTSTITARIGKLIARSVSPESILCITFTNKAAQEMRERICRSYGDKGKMVYVSTFHSLCVDLIRHFGSVIGYTARFTILDEDDQENLISQVARQLYAKQADVEYTKPKLRWLLGVINDWRENMGTQEDLEKLAHDEEIEECDLKVIREYLRRMQAANAIDFSGLLAETVRLLKFNDPNKIPEQQILSQLHGHFRYIQVDEYQDTNSAQNEIVELLAGPHDNVMAVGDQDQSIYEWRGANPEGITTFIKRGRAKRGCKVYQLSTNYRSTPEIIASADKLIRHCPNRMEIEFKAHNPSIERPPRLDHHNSPEDEGNNVAEKIRALMSLRGIPAREIAVFYRLNDMSRPIETALARRQIPYKVVGGMSFYDRVEVKDCLAMLRLLINPKDSAAFSRVINKPKRGIGEKAVGLVENYAAMKNIDLITACSYAEEFFEGSSVGDQIRSLYSIYRLDTHGKNPADALSEIVARSEYYRHLEEISKEDKTRAEDRKRNVQELLNSVALWSQENPGGSVEKYLQYVALLTSFDNGNRNPDAVSLMSLHASKGLEFDCVFMVGVEQGMLPNKKATDERQDMGLHEERRLCYVGMTRARKQLFMNFCWHRQGGYQRGKGVQYENRRPSQFLLEAGLISEEEFIKGAKASIVS